ncbi:MAG: membrane protease YdiL (CAAX protease family) [Mariniblastus sp.]|jgi:membrane protease YdiL (CAAX protease family)
MPQDTHSADAHPSSYGPRDVAAICFAMAFPTLVTLVYFQWLKDADALFQQIAFGIGKCIQFGFPIVWIWLWHRSRLKRTVTPELKSGSTLEMPSSQSTDIGLAVGFGLLVAVSMFAIYFLLLADSLIATELVLMVKEKVTDMDINSFAKYIGVGVFYALCHSFMEEYYWRWFVFDMLEKFVSTPIANVLSSLGFMAHHVVLLGFFFNWQWLTYPLSLCIAIGGMFWAWQYKRTGSLRTSWISHMIVDAGIFALGYFLIREMF